MVEEEHEVVEGDGEEKKSSFDVPTPIFQDIITFCKYPRSYVHLEALPRNVYFLGRKLKVWYGIYSRVSVFQGAAGKM